MEKIVVNEDEEMELTKVDGDLEVLDGAVVNVPSGVLNITGELVCKGDVVIKGGVHASKILLLNGYLEIEGDAQAEGIQVSSSKMRNGSQLTVYGNVECEKAEIDGGLEVDKNFTCTVAKNIDQSIDFFDKMEALHTARWKKDGKQGSFANDNWVKFHKDVIREGFPRGEALLVEVTSGSEVLGYLYGHPYNGTAYMQQTGFSDAKASKFRPGYVSHLMTMLYCADKGMISYDFLPDDEKSYKKFFTNPSEPVYWVRLQKPRFKFFIEKLIRSIFNRC